MARAKEWSSFRFSTIKMCAMLGADRPKLSLFDSTCLIVGIIVGSGIYETPAGVAQVATQNWQVYSIWALGGLISLCGACCYAELATRYPESGGDVVYLRKAYGQPAGFLFGWLQTFVARPGDISLMAFVFSRYVYSMLHPERVGDPPVWPANMCVIVLTVVNIAGLRFGKSAQNLLTIAKVLGLLVIVALAMMSPQSDSTVASPLETQMTWGVALIMVLFAYGGWNEMVYVASEVQEPQRNIWRALLMGTTAITCLYLLANFAFLRSLTLPGLAQSSAVATDAVRPVIPRSGQLLVALVIAISAAGAMNGLIMTGARITSAMEVYPAFRWMGKWDSSLHTPVRALCLQGVISVLVITFARTFSNALIYTSAAVYSFYLATCISTVVLRWKDPTTERLFRVPLYPLPVILFASACVMMIRSAIGYRPYATLVCFAILVVGGLFYLVQSRWDGAQGEQH